MIKNINSALLVTAVTTLLYCTSAAHVGGFFSGLNGFMNIWSIDGDALERNFHQIIYHGLTLQIKPLLILAFIPLLYLVISYCYRIWRINHPQKSVSRPQAYLIRTLKAQEEPKLIMAFLLFATFFSFIISMAIFEIQGKAKADVLKFNIEKGKMISIAKYNDKALIFLFCGARNCAGLDIEEKSVIYFPQSEFSIMKGFVKNGKLEIESSLIKH